MPYYCFKCEKCGGETDHMFPMGQRPEQVACDECGGMSKFKLIPPGIMTHSYLDGQKRKGYQDLKEASKLNVLASRTDNQAEKAEIKKELNKTGHTFAKENK